MPKPKTILAVVLTTVPMAAIGWLIGEHFDRTPLALVAGIAMGIPFGMFLASRRRRWLVVGLLNLLFVVAFDQGGWIATTAAVSASLLTFMMSAMILRELYHDSEWKALIQHAKLALGLNGPTQIIQDGKTTAPGTSGPHFGPRNVIVKPNNAVILERGSAQSEIKGPSFFALKPYEYVKTIVDLRPVSETIHVENALTSNQITVGISLLVTYGLDIAENVRLGQDQLSAADKLTLQTIDLRMPDWRSATRSILDSSVRAAVSGKSLDELLKARQQPHLANEITNLAEAQTLDLHIRVFQVVVQEIHLPTEISQGRSGLLLADMEAQARKTLETARAQAVNEMLTDFARAYNAAIRNGLEERDIHRFVMREILEHTLGDPTNRGFAAPELNALLASLRY